MNASIDKKKLNMLVSIRISDDDYMNLIIISANVGTVSKLIRKMIRHMVEVLGRNGVNT